MLCLVAQLCMTLCDPTDSSPPGSSVHAILQARILEWVAMPSSGDLSNPGIKPRSPTMQADSLPTEPPGKLPTILELVSCPFSRGSFRPWTWTRVACIAGGFFTTWAIREAHVNIYMKSQYRENKSIVGQSRPVAAQRGGGGGGRVRSNWLQRAIRNFRGNGNALYLNWQG